MKPQISIRTAFFLMTLAAILIVVIRQRPDASITIEFTDPDNARINGVEVETKELATKVESERRWRSLWLQDSIVKLIIPAAFFVDSNSEILGPQSTTLQTILSKSTVASSNRVSIRLSKLEEFIAEQKIKNIAEIEIGGTSLKTNNDISAK